MIFTAKTIESILERMRRGISLSVDWRYDWSGKRYAYRAWICHGNCRIELNQNSEWLDHLVYEIVNFPEVWYDLETNTYKIRGA